jgi:hypothetical protein
MRKLALVVGALLLAAACNPNADTDNPAVATDNAAAERAADAPSQGANSFTEDQARQRLADNGYTSPGPLMQAADGTWRGQATINGETADVVVDYQGNVTTSN